MRGQAMPGRHSVICCGILIVALAMLPAQNLFAAGRDYRPPNVVLGCRRLATPGCDRGLRRKARTNAQHRCPREDRDSFRQCLYAGKPVYAGARLDPDRRLSPPARSGAGHLSPGFPARSRRNTRKACRTHGTTIVIGFGTTSSSISTTRVIRTRISASGIWAPAIPGSSTIGNRSTR